MTADLRLGRWQDVLADVERCDSLITDPPYSARTADGYRSGTDAEHDEIHQGTGIQYGVLGQGDADAIAAWWHTRVARWVVIFCDHTAWRWHEDAWSRFGWYTFAPVLWVRRGSAPRFCGDGPANQVDHVMVARPRNLERDGSRPGWYMADTPRGAHVVGAKDPLAMRALVRDYSRPGDLVVDPYAGSGTTAIACSVEGRPCITAECLPEHYEIARKRIARGFTTEMFANG